MKRALFILMLIAGLAGMVFGVVFTVMAVRFHEWGRVIFYGFIALLALEVFIFGILNLKKKS